MCQSSDRAETRALTHIIEATAAHKVFVDAHSDNQAVVDFFHRLQQNHDAYIDANPDNKELHIWLDNALNKFDEIYSGDRPGFLDGYKKLKDEITPWGD